MIVDRPARAAIVGGVARAASGAHARTHQNDTPRQTSAAPAVHCGVTLLFAPVGAAHAAPRLRPPRRTSIVTGMTAAPISCLTTAE